MAVEPIRVAKADDFIYLLPKYGNRHGLIAGATGTGKTVTLQGIVEGFSKIGVPVFVADVKGDLSGIAMAGGGKDVFEKRAADLGISPYEHRGFPVQFWDVYGKQGHPLRATISDMGPLILARLLDLNEVQEGLLTMAFKVADDNQMLLLDLKDLRALLTFMGENAKSLTLEYGNVSSTSIGAIQRSLLTLDQQGAEDFFGEPALDLSDLIRTNHEGLGMVNILAASELYQNPRVYATSLLWLLSELFEDLPEVGDMEKPKLVFFFDEAHLLFSDAPKALVEKVEQVVRLIRSKGVGVYFITQNPIDIPDAVLGQLGNRVQHALRAFSPRDQKAVKVAAETFRANPKFSVEEAITQLAVGEALVSFLDEKGTPGVVERAMIAPPASRVAPATEAERTQIVQSGPVYGKYEDMVDRESAYEVLKARAVKALPQEGTTGNLPGPLEPRRPAARRSDSIVESLAKSVLRSAGSQLGRDFVRGVLGSLLKRR